MVLRIELIFQSQGETRRQVIGGAQIWGQLGNDWRIFVSQRTESGALPHMRLPEPSTPNIHLYPEPADATKELDEALASAKSDHQRVLVVFGANWCYDCHVLDEAMNSAKIAASPALRLSMPAAKWSAVKNRESLNPRRKSG